MAEGRDRRLEAEESIWTRCVDATPRDQRNLWRMLGILAVWAVTFLGATQGIKRGLVPEGPAMWLAAGVPIAVGVLVIAAYSRFLKEADELQRVIHYQALALGFGGGWLAASGAAIFEKMGATVVGVEMITLSMAGVYSIWIVFAQLRYR